MMRVGASMMNKLALIDLPLTVFSDLATKPLFSNSGWISPPERNYPNKKVSADFLCQNCEKEKTFSGDAYSYNDLSIEYQQQLQMSSPYMGVPHMPNNGHNNKSISELLKDIALPAGDTVTIKLTCPTCERTVYICYAIEIECFPIEIISGFSGNTRQELGSKICVIKIGEYPNQEESRLFVLDKYKDMFIKEHKFLVLAERAYYSQLGAGSVIYIRKAYESLLYDILDKNSIPRPRTFSELLKTADGKANIVPTILKDKAYGLFGELSDIVHGDCDDDIGMTKYKDLRDVFCVILDNLLEQSRLESIAKNLKVDSKKQGGTK